MFVVKKTVLTFFGCLYGLPVGLLRFSVGLLRFIELSGFGRLTLRPQGTPETQFQPLGTPYLVYSFPEKTAGLL